MVIAKRPAASAVPVKESSPSRTLTVACGAAAPLTWSELSQRTAGSGSSTGAPESSWAVTKVASSGVARGWPARSVMPVPARRV